MRDHGDRDGAWTGCVTVADLQLQPVDTTHIGNKTGGWCSGALQLGKTAMRLVGKRPAVVQRFGRGG